MPLGYSFRLYTYGPYDPQLLEDLKIAKGRGAILCRKFDRQGGTGYEIKTGHPIMTRELAADAEPLLSNYSELNRLGLARIRCLLQL